jgi:Fe-S cluster assembly ATP-binding protein
MYRGRIVASGGGELVQALEANGYDWVRERYGAEEEAYEPAAAT